MPELPEVEASRILVNKLCSGKRIATAEALEDDKIFEGCGGPAAGAALKGRTLEAAHRRGKYMWWDLSAGGPSPLIHFGMTGSFKIRDPAGVLHQLEYESVSAEDNWPPRFQKLLLTFDDGTQLAYCDPRRFGRFKMLEGGGASSTTVKELGFDPLTDMPDAPAFVELVRKRAKGATRLKPLLLDQSFSAGVGNWMADEILYHARLHPEQLVSALGEEELGALHGALHKVMQVATAAEFDSRRYPADWMFFVRWGKKDAKLGGHKLDHITVGGRTSAFVPALQKLIGGQNASPSGASKAKTKAKGGKRSSKSAPDSSEDDEPSSATSEGASDDDDGTTAAAAAAAATESSKKAAARAAGPRGNKGKAPAATAAAAAPAAPTTSRRRRGAGTASKRPAATAVEVGADEDADQQPADKAGSAPAAKKRQTAAGRSKAKQ